MKLAIATLLFGAAAASDSIKANSSVGKKVLSKARRLGGNDNNGDMSWAVDYSLRFEKCATSTDYYGGYFGGNGNNNQNNNNRANYNGMYEQRLVHFKLCPTSTCGKGCSGGADYVIDMNEFVGAYLEHKEEEKEAQCEAAREACDCEDANDDEVSFDRAARRGGSCQAAPSAPSHTHTSHNTTSLQISRPARPSAS